MQLKQGLEEQKESSSRKGNDFLYRCAIDLLPILILVGIVSLLFGKVIFESQSISKICRIAEWDSVFSKYSTGYSTSIDPSLIQLLIPSYFLIAKLWHLGSLPLWNPYSGFGVPLLANIQLRAFSLLHLPLYLFPQMHVYNLIIVLHTLIAMCGAYWLARAFDFSKPSSIFSSLTYGFCPHLLWYSEWMGNDYALLPLLFCFFVRMAKNPNLKNITLAAVSCSVFITSSHPESSFFGVIFASVLALTIMLTTASRSANYILKPLKSLLTCGAISFGLAAPVLLPFIEYLQNSDSYKFNIVSTSILPWQAFLYNLIQPGFHDASPFLGVVAFLFLILAIFYSRSQMKSVLITAIIAAVVLTAAGPLAQVVYVKPFSYVMTLYCLPVVLLLLSLLSASGLETLSNKTMTPKLLSILACAALVILVIPFMLHFLKVPLSVGDFNLALPNMAVDMKFWRTSLALLAITGLLIAAKQVNQKRFGWLVVAGLIACNLFSEISIAKAAIAVQPKFDYGNVELLSYIKKLDERVVSIGNHTLIPESNVVYEIYQLQCSDAMFPSRFLEFAKFCGANVGQFIQIFDNKLSSRLDLASVKYVVSSIPVFPDDDKQNALVKVSLNQDWGSIKLLNAFYNYDSKNADVFGKLYFHSKQAERYSFSLVLFDQKHNPVWFGDQQKLLHASSNGDYCESFAAPISLRLSQGSNCILGVQIFDRTKYQFLKADGDALIPIAHIDVGSSVGELESNRHYKLIYETPNCIRVYQNQHALPLAYVAHNVLFAESANQALSMLSQKNFNPHNTVILEQNRNSSIDLSTDPNSASIEPAKLIRLNNNKELVTFQSNKPGVLVVTNIFYPGWKAVLDGKEVPIMHANYAFRGVFIPSGRHLVEFSYVPLSFWLGCALSIGALIVLMLTFILKLNLLKRHVN